ncbi:hypothetical protein [Ilumatobacter sp.]|uniref:hypothetical protein n=1 Tax=Ilumatobacter sp. TaxID=1967498 RepID=UPI002A2E0ED0|nr:hypothetical protein [Ilumatobacter sp.]
MDAAVGREFINDRSDQTPMVAFQVKPQRIDCCDRDDKGHPWRFSDAEMFDEVKVIRPRISVLNGNEPSVRATAQEHAVPERCCVHELLNPVCTHSLTRFDKRHMREN